MTSRVPKLVHLSTHINLVMRTWVYAPSVFQTSLRISDEVNSLVTLTDNTLLTNIKTRKWQIMQPGWDSNSCNLDSPNIPQLLCRAQHFMLPYLHWILHLFSGSSMDTGATPRTQGLSDQLRHAASKGQLDQVISCLQAGAALDTDQVTMATQPLF